MLVSAIRQMDENLAKKISIPATEKNLGGRPLSEIDLEEAKKLCQIWCTQNEMCAIFGVHETTLNTKLREAGYDGFSGFFAKYSADGNISLRRAQKIAAIEDRSVPMMIWLGKQRLGQTDKVEERIAPEVKVEMTPEAKAEQLENDKLFTIWKKEREKLLAAEQELKRG